LKLAKLTKLSYMVHENTCGSGTKKSSHENRQSNLRTIGDVQYGRSSPATPPSDGRASAAVREVDCAALVGHQSTTYSSSGHACRWHGVQRVLLEAAALLPPATTCSYKQLTKSLHFLSNYYFRHSLCSCRHESSDFK
jgi:hypothetical protein